MAKNSITDYDNIANNNTDIQSVDIAENCAPSGINNAIREMMADLADVNDGTVALTSPKAVSLSTDTINESTTDNGVSVDGMTVKDGSPYTDSIFEKTTNNGVSIDGVVAKDSIIQASGQPSFRASRTAGTTTAGSTFIFNDVHHNNGSHYNSTTGVFTAPVTGYYYISFTCLLNNTNAAGTYYVNLVSSGNKLFAATYAPANTFASAGASAVLYLAASDTVTVKANSGTWYGSLTENTVFSGHLIS